MAEEDDNKTEMDTLSGAVEDATLRRKSTDMDGADSFPVPMHISEAALKKRFAAKYGDNSLNSAEGAVSLSSDDTVLGGFDIRQLRMAILALAEAGEDRPEVHLCPRTDPGARENCRFFSIDPTCYDKAGLLKLVKDGLTYSNYADKGMGKFYEDIKRLSDRYLIDKDMLSWLKDKQAALWMWCYLKNKSQSYSPGAKIQSITLGNQLPRTGILTPSHLIVSSLPDFYEQLGIPEPELNTAALNNAVIAFFDHWLINRVNKLTELNVLKDYWVALNSSDIIRDPFVFLDDGGKDDIKWCWEYVKNKIPMKCWWDFNIASDKDKRVLLPTLYLVWEALPDSKKLFVHELRRAWSQRKFREKTKSRKLFQTYIDPDKKKMLSELAGERGIKINEALERLIEDAYFLNRDKKKKKQMH